MEDLPGDDSRRIPVFEFDVAPGRGGYTLSIDGMLTLTGGMNDIKITPEITRENDHLILRGTVATDVNASLYRLRATLETPAMPSS